MTPGGGGARGGTGRDEGGKLAGAGELVDCPGKTVTEDVVDAKGVGDVVAFVGSSVVGISSTSVVGDSCLSIDSEA